MLAASLAWMILVLHSSGLAAESTFIARACERLEKLQGADGAWAGEDGVSPDVHVTLEALRALKVCSAYFSAPGAG